MTKLAKPGQWTSGGPIKYRAIGPPSAPTAFEIGVDYGRAPVPDHFYVADYVHVLEEDGQVLLTFGKLDKPAKDRLRSKIEVYFAPIMFVRQLWKSSKDDFRRTLRIYVEKHGLRPPKWDRLLEAPKVQTFQSNNVLMVLSEGECLLDFFYLSPKDVYIKMRRQEVIDLEPLIRIILSPAILHAFLDACEPLAVSLQARLGEANEDLEPEPSV